MAFNHSITIAASAAALFDLTQDYGRRLAWDPFLKAAVLVDGASAAGLGVRALCTAWHGLAMETEYISFKPPESCAVRMTQGPWPIQRFAGTWRFVETGPGQTEVSFHYHLEARPRWLSPVLARVFARDTRQRLEALKLAVERQGILSA